MMMQLLNEFPIFLLILARISAFFVAAPLYSYRTIPTTHKVGVSVFLSWFIFLSLDEEAIPIDEVFFLLVMKEVMVGLIIGIIAFIIVSAIQIAGGFIDFQMGFAIANVIDPQTGTQSPIIGQYFYVFALLLMLTLNAHHLLLDGIYYSYQFIPLDQLSIPIGSDKFSLFVSKTFNAMFIIAFQMSIPVVGSLFLVDVALGIVARTVPQLNIFVVGVPLKIIVAFFILIISMPVFIMLFEQLFTTMFYTMRELMGILGGS
jgi:flagellar biosynthetic protein FliR